MIVDDHAPNRLLLSQQLDFAGHRSVAVESGSQALLAWSQTSIPFDVVITDCNMPEMSGFELARRLRQMEQIAASAPVPILGLTAMAEQDVASRARNAGMTDCLFKPLEMASLLARIDGSSEITAPAAADNSIIKTLDKLAKSNPRAFEDLALTIIEQNQKDMAELTTYIETADYSRIAITAHNILGGARLIAATELENSSRELELAAKNNDSDQIIHHYQQCQTLILNIEQQLQEALQKKP